MNVNKEAGVDCGLELSPEEMERINAMSKKKLEPGEVYAFAVRLCDNEIDRDNERFPAATLEELAPLFVGRSGLFDHQWSTRNQAARIYRTEVVRESWMTEAGEPYCYLKGCAYLLRTEGNRELIAAIEGGIKKEVSVGCAVERSVCSICGEEFHTCPHEKGAEYGGRRCWAELVGATDAYEWSFVAVPAQRNAGVMKHMRMEQEAALGRKYLESLRGEVARPGWDWSTPCSGASRTSWAMTSCWPSRARWSGRPSGCSRWRPNCGMAAGGRTAESGTGHF